MRFLSMVRINENAGQAPSERLMREMGKLMEEMTRSGKLVSTAGLTPTENPQHGLCLLCRVEVAPDLA